MYVAMLLSRITIDKRKSELHPHRHPQLPPLPTVPAVAVPDMTVNDEAAVLPPPTICLSNIVNTVHKKRNESEAAGLMITNHLPLSFSHLLSLLPPLPMVCARTPGFPPESGRGLGVRFVRLSLTVTDLRFAC